MDISSLNNMIAAPFSFLAKSLTFLFSNLFLILAVITLLVFAFLAFCLIMWAWEKSIQRKAKEQPQ